MPQGDEHRSRPKRSTAQRIERALDLILVILSPITLLGLGGLILGAYGTYEFGLPFYSAFVGLGVGVFLGFIVKAAMYINW